MYVCTHGHMYTYTGVDAICMHVCLCTYMYVRLHILKYLIPEFHHTFVGMMQIKAVEISVQLIVSCAHLNHHKCEEEMLRP